ncbi:isochorismatase family protein [Paenibacillus chartarius]|uniref:Isochorismatase family protein n=1 Tax=Paenibacillus chartarius TaxID=747481 RepID=A0ABV6DI06_9BACL
MRLESIWEDLLLGDDQKVIEKGGFGKPRGLGSRPALLVIDPQPNYMGTREPILKQLDEFPTGVGEKAWEALEKSLPVLNLFRERGLPVIFSRQIAKYMQFDSFANKSGRDRSNYVEGHPYTELVAEVNRQPTDIVIDKGYASVFVGTPLVNYLNRLQVDTLIVCGGVTSGCVRAAVVDAASLNYRVGVLYECLFDRIELSHRVSLLDMWMKYADMLSVDDALEYINTTK